MLYKDTTANKQTQQMCKHKLLGKLVIKDKLCGRK